MKRKRATIRDVARLAKVAPITVSRVVNNSGYISDDTRERVESAIAELNYIPNNLSQSLRFQRTNMVTLLISDVSDPGERARLEQVYDELALFEDYVRNRRKRLR